MADPSAQPRDLTAAEYRRRRPGIDPNPEFLAARADIHTARQATPNSTTDPTEEDQ